MDKKWQILDSVEIFKNRFFRLRSDRCLLPDGREMPDYYVMEFTHWVNIIPVTHDGQIVLIKQYRHGSGEVCIEVPGGAIDPGSKEDPKVAALRELKEETGYVPEDLRLVGKHRPNPANQNNYMYTYIGLGCQKLAEQELDPFEDIEVMTVSVAETLQMVFDGKITHSIILASLFQVLPFLGYKIV